MNKSDRSLVWWNKIATTYFYIQSFFILCFIIIFASFFFNLEHRYKVQSKVQVHYAKETSDSIADGYFSWELVLQQSNCNRKSPDNVIVKKLKWDMVHIYVNIFTFIQIKIHKYDKNL